MFRILFVILILSSTGFVHLYNIMVYLSFSVKWNIPRSCCSIFANWTISFLWQLGCWIGSRGPRRSYSANFGFEWEEKFDGHAVRTWFKPFPYRSKCWTDCQNTLQSSRSSSQTWSDVEHSRQLLNQSTTAEDIWTCKRIGRFHAGTTNAKRFSCRARGWLEEQVSWFSR